MNYKVEDDFDFYSELNNTYCKKEDHDVALCMISHELLTHNSVTLPCKHSFNYMPLYTELCIVVDNENTKYRTYINCPYCRSKFDKLIPYIPLPTVKKIYGVNFPTSLTMPAPKCSFIIKNGKYKGNACGHSGTEFENGIWCEKHVLYNINSVWTPEKEQLSKTKSVAELKTMLKDKGLSVGGVKKELVNRLFSAH
jgi:hypothetical protein